MLRELGPADGSPSVELIEEPTEAQTDAFYAAARQSGFSFALDAKPPAPQEDEEEAQQSMSLLDVAEAVKSNPASMWESVQIRPFALQTPAEHATPRAARRRRCSQADPRLQDRSPSVYRTRN